MVACPIESIVAIELGLGILKEKVLEAEVGLDIKDKKKN